MEPALVDVFKGREFYNSLQAFPLSRSAAAVSVHAGKNNVNSAMVNYPVGVGSFSTYSTGIATSDLFKLGCWYCGSRSGHLKCGHQGI